MFSTREHGQVGATILGDRRQRERVVGVGRPAVGQRSHVPPPAPSRTCRIAARMFG
ncbi:MAG: hypothetical protein QOG07_1464 [Pseudonocardiales bacterium]|nr:hypothetical protein [Pseudonocardiales bacterium]